MWFSLRGHNESNKENCSGLCLREYHMVFIKRPSVNYFCSQYDKVDQVLRVWDWREERTKAKSEWEATGSSGLLKWWSSWYGWWASCSKKSMKMVALCNNHPMFRFNEWWWSWCGWQLRLACSMKSMKMIEITIVPHSMKIHEDDCTNNHPTFSPIGARVVQVTSGLCCAGRHDQCLIR